MFWWEGEAWRADQRRGNGCNFQDEQWIVWESGSLQSYIGACECLRGWDQNSTNGVDKGERQAMLWIEHQSALIRQTKFRKRIHHFRLFLEDTLVLFNYIYKRKKIILDMLSFSPCVSWILFGFRTLDVPCCCHWHEQSFYCVRMTEQV